MRYIAIDTNFWIYVASGVSPDDGKRNPGLYYKIIELLESLIQDQSIEIVVPEVIIQELVSHDEKLRSGIAKTENRKKVRLKEFRSFGKNLNGQDQQLLEELAKRVDESLENDVEIARSYHQRVKDIISSSRKIAISDAVKIQCSDWAFKKLPPFHGEKSSMADALIFFSVVEFIDSIKEELPFDDDYIYPESYFVTYNKKDFGEDQFFDGLREIAESRNIHFSTSITDTVFELTKTVNKEIEEELLRKELLETEYDYYKNL